MTFTSKDSIDGLWRAIEALPSMKIKYEPPYGEKRQLLANPAMAFRVFIVGECGDGKSTIVNIMTQSDTAETGKRARGVIKDVYEHMYSRRIRGRSVVVIDSPGVGDKDVTPMKLLGMLEDKLGACGVDSGPLDGIIVTSPVIGGRCHPRRHKIGQGRIRRSMLIGEVMPEFYEYAADKRGTVTFTSKDSIDGLWRAIAALPSMKILSRRGRSALAAKLAGHGHAGLGAWRRRLLAHSPL